MCLYRRCFRLLQVAITNNFTIILFILSVICLPQLTVAQEPPPIRSRAAAEWCANAPSESLRMICMQLSRWDSSAREQLAARPSLTIGPPGIIGETDGSHENKVELARIPHSPYQCMTLDCICPYLKGHLSSNDETCILPSGKPLKKAIRREYRTLSDYERDRYHEAMNQLKKDGVFKTFATIHTQTGNSSGAHSGPGFLGWHREFMKRLEIALRILDPSLAIPYWDSTLDQPLPDPKDSIMWSEEFMGAEEESGELSNGPFSGWRTLENNPHIKRNRSATGALFSEDQLNTVYQMRNIEQILSFTTPQEGCPHEVDFNSIEYTHGLVHFWIGGDFSDQATAANDPIFYQHHGFIDLIWETWRQKQQTRRARETAYPKDMQQCSNKGHFVSAYMSPFEPLKNIDGLSNGYTDNLYEYGPRPTCPHCGHSKYLFCDRSQNAAPHCVAKVRIGGRCDGFDSSADVCYDGVCTGGRCVSTHRHMKSSSHVSHGSTGALSPISSSAAHVIKPHNVDLDHRDLSSSEENFGTNNGHGHHHHGNKKQRRPPASSAAHQHNHRHSHKPKRTEQPLSKKQQPPQQQADCYNEHQCCNLWSSQGECDHNPHYMNSYCRPSCKQCEPTFMMNTECSDHHQNCEHWMKQGECISNKIWMAENCRKSCKLCNGPTRLQICSGKAHHHSGPVPPLPASAAKTLSLPHDGHDFTSHSDDFHKSKSGPHASPSKSSTAGFLPMPIVAVRSAPSAKSNHGDKHHRHHHRHDSGSSSSSSSSVEDMHHHRHHVSAHSSKKCASPGCYNEFSCCSEWQRQGHCKLHAEWMSCNCRVSCGICKPYGYEHGLCHDYHHDCHAWAHVGQCDSNPWMLENCRSSCGTCYPPHFLHHKCRLEAKHRTRHHHRHHRDRGYHLV